MHVNYRFILDFIQKNRAWGRILDYGCGAGEVVRAGLEQRLNIFGCETFYEGSHGTREQVADLLGTRILEMKDSRIPFPDSHFDCIVNNMVMEHVENIDMILSDMRRVLKPNGIMLSLFPTKEVIKEGHCGVPLAHKFASSRFGYYWLLAGRSIGLGSFTEGKTSREWARDFHGWLKSYCFYRSRKEILSAFSRNNLSPIGIESEYIKFRGLPFFTPWLLRKCAMTVLLSPAQSLKRTGLP